MYVPQSTDPKLSMYSNWQIRKPAEDNPFKLAPYESLGLYETRKYDHAYTIAKPKELDLIQTHSSYWTFKEEKEKAKGKDDDTSKEEKETEEVKSEEQSSKSPEQCVMEESGPSLKREAEDASPDPQDKNSQEGEEQGQEGSTVKRIKIFEGGFKSMEDYTYVRGRGRGRYVCETCGIRCKKPSMLRKHIRTHTDLRPYACVHCSFSFKTKGNLTKHLRSKAHYKRCEEMGVIPVPTVVDDSHLNHRALAMQGKLEQEGRMDALDCDDDDDDDEDEDDEDGDDDEDDDDDEGLEGGSIQFQDAQGHTHLSPDTPPSPEEESMEETRQEARDTSREAQVRSMRSGVLVMHSASPALPTTTILPLTHVSKQGRATDTIGDSPMDLSLRKMATATIPITHVADNSLLVKKLVIPCRPSCLPLMARPAVPDLRSPVASLASPATPSTPIKEHPFEILSPVTESSSLLKSIYNTTERVSHASYEKLHVVPDPTKENGSSSFMLQAYLKERAVQDTTIKRQQYKDSSSDTSPDSIHEPPLLSSKRMPNLTPIRMSTLTKMSNSSSTSIPTSTSRHASEITQTLMKTERIKESETSSIDRESKISVHDRENQSPSSTSSPAPTPIPTTTAITTTTITTITLAVSSSTITSVTSSISQAASITSSIATAITTTSRMPTPPANLTVVNNGGLDTKTAFLVPSGVVPSSLNRLGNDDGKCKCSFCHKEFNRHSQLSIHMNIHYMERPYRCESCAVSFRTNGHLQKHKRSVSHFNKVNMNMTFGPPSSDNPRPFKCRDCKIAFRIHGHLAKHLRSKMHIMKLECLGKLPFGTYAEMERSGANLNEIDTTDCDNSLESLKVMATRMYEKDPGKLSAWSQTQQHPHRVRTVSNSSTSSDDYPLQDDQDDPTAHATPPNDDDTGTGSPRCGVALVCGV